MSALKPVICIQRYGPAHEAAGGGVPASSLAALHRRSLPPGLHLGEQEKFHLEARRKCDLSLSFYSCSF